MKLLIKFSYCGTAYSGYQVQNNAPTVQQKINEAALAIFGQECSVTGCSRTDSGVHANEFCATVTFKGTDFLETKIPLPSIPLAFCAHLPTDISVREASWVESSFHPRYDVKMKEYLYRIKNSPVSDPFDYGRVWLFTHKITDDGFEKMKAAAQYIVG